MRNEKRTDGWGVVVWLNLFYLSQLWLVAWEVTEIPKLRSGSNRGKDRVLGIRAWLDPLSDDRSVLITGYSTYK